MLHADNAEHLADVEERLADIMSRKTIAERFQMASDANETARALIAGFLKTRFPDWTDAQVQAEVARRMLDEA